LAQLGPHTGYASGVLGPLILTGIGLGLVIAPGINTGTFGVAPQDAGVASATSHRPAARRLDRHLAAEHHLRQRRRLLPRRASRAARIIGRQALTGLALAHGYDTAFWWTAGIFSRASRGPSPSPPR
jgi:hypothetical protein